MDILQKTKIEGITIVGVPGSNSEKYTQIYPHIKFMSIDDYENGGILGDVNGDGYVDIDDVTLIQQYLVGLTVKDFNKNTADVNKDGTINIYDATIIQVMILQANQ